MAGTHQVQLRREERECMEVSFRNRLPSHKLLRWDRCPESHFPLSMQMSLNEGWIWYLAGRR